MKLLFSLLLFCFFSTGLFAQSANDYWKEGVAAFNTQNYSLAIKNFKQYDALMPKKTTAQFYLAQSYDFLFKPDSAIYFYEKTLDYHKSIHLNKPARVKLSRAYLRQKDFVNAYRVALESMLIEPDDPHFALEFKDVCLWPYLISNRKLDPNYLTNPQKQISYIVNTVTEQKVITRNIINEKGIPFDSDTRRNIGFAERWYGSFDNPDEPVSIHFVFTTKELAEEVDEQDANAMKVFQNEQNPIFERVGAMYAMMPFDKKKMATILEYDEPIIRYCACKEMRSDIPKKYQKICLKDEREMVQKAVKINPALNP